jgi:hypothetical protein
MVGRRLLIAGIAWIAVLGGHPIAGATERPDPKPLWEAFPLETERGGSGASARVDQSRPARPPAAEPAPGKDPRRAALLAAAALFVLTAGVLAWGRWRRQRRGRAGRVSATAWGADSRPAPAPAATPRARWRCEILRYESGPHESQFCAVATEPRRGQRWTVDESAAFRWASKADPHPGLPEFDELRSLASRLMAAGWKPAQAELGERNRRFVWTRKGRPPRIGRQRPKRSGARSNSRAARSYSATVPMSNQSASSARNAATRSPAATRRRTSSGN